MRTPRVEGEESQNKVNDETTSSETSVADEKLLQLHCAVITSVGDGDENKEKSEDGE